MRTRMFAAPVAGIVKQRSRWVGAGKWPVVVNIHPKPGDIGLALGQDWHGRVVAMQPLGGQDMSLDTPVQRHEGKCGSTNLVGKCRDAERHAFAGETLGLTVERLVLAIFLEEKHGEETGPSPTAWHDMEGRRRLRDLLAGPTRELLPHGLDDLPRSRDHLERFGHILAELGQACAATGWARAGRRDDDALARQMLGKWFPGRALAFKGHNPRRFACGGFRNKVVLAGVRLEVSELELHLLDETTATFRAGTKLLAPELRDLQLEMGNRRLDGALASLGIGSARFRFLGAFQGNSEQRLQRLDVVWKG